MFAARRTGNAVLMLHEESRWDSARRAKTEMTKEVGGAECEMAGYNSSWLSHRDSEAANGGKNTAKIKKGG